MEDLIKRSDAIKAIDDKVNGSDNRLWLREIILELPSADRPQVNPDLVKDFLKRQYEAVLEENKMLKENIPSGKWKRKIVDNGFNADWVCSECGYRVKTDFVDYHYCPHCGCRMKGAEDESTDRLLADM